MVFRSFIGRRNTTASYLKANYIRFRQQHLSGSNENMSQIPSISGSSKTSHNHELEQRIYLTNLEIGIKIRIRKH